LGARFWKKNGSATPFGKRLSTQGRSSEVHDGRVGHGQGVVDDVALAPPALREEHLVGTGEPHLPVSDLEHDRVVSRGTLLSARTA